MTRLDYRVESQPSVLGPARASNGARSSRFVSPRSTYTRAATSGSLTPLMRAAAIGHVERVEELLSDGVDVNARGPRGSTALMFAAGGGHLEIVRLLMENGADARLREDGGWSALDHAREDDESGIVEYLSHWDEGDRASL